MPSSHCSDDNKFGETDWPLNPRHSPASFPGLGLQLQKNQFLYVGAGD